VKPLFAVTAPAHAALYLAAVESVRERLGDEAFGVETRAGSLLTGQATLVELLAYLQGVLDSAEEPEPSTKPATEPDGRPPLTAREREVLTLLVRGESNKEIAVALFVSPKTVMHHTVAIYRKLGVSGRAEAATKAARLGLVPQG
jgi:DNA-binding NarL/FixJ family response regulator